MHSLYERHDYPTESFQAGTTLETCRKAMALLQAVDVARAMAFTTAIHLQAQTDGVPDDRLDFAHDLMLLEAAKPLWLLARYTAHLENDDDLPRD